jgi:hypothetical protein
MVLPEFRSQLRKGIALFFSDSQEKFQLLEFLQREEESNLKQLASLLLTLLPVTNLADGPVSRILCRTQFAERTAHRGDHSSRPRFAP